MKKISALILIFLLLCGCGGGKEITPRLTGISFRAEMTYYNEEYSFLGEISGEGVLTCEMTAPDGLAEMVFTVDGGGILTEYKGLTYSPAEGSLPFAAVIEQFYSCIKEIINDPEAVADQKGVLKTEAYTLTVSPSGLPQRLTVRRDGFYINFYNISVTEE